MGNSFWERRKDATQRTMNQVEDEMDPGGTEYINTVMDDDDLSDEPEFNSVIYCGVNNSKV